LARSLREDRDPTRVIHGLEDLLAQRVYGLACGYEDANDAARLSDDPVHKLLLGRDAITGEALASQPTLSRFENGVGRAELRAMSQALFERVVGRQKRRLRGRVRTITVDLDVTDDPTHGAQQLAFFNGYYDTWCYLPLLAFLTFNGEPEQYLVAAALRPGNAPTQSGALPLLRRILARLRQRFPKARILVRLDGGFVTPELLTFLEEAGVGYVLGLPGNARLLRPVQPLLGAADALSECTGETAHVYGELSYAAHTWERERRVLVKAEVVRIEGRKPRDNPRFVVTNLRGTPQALYERIYCQRGEIENRIKELLYGLALDRTSCSRFLANQMRVLLTAAAYALLQEIRTAAQGTGCARAQVTTLRDRLFKLGVRVVVSVRRIVFHLPAAFPFRKDWQGVALALGAHPG